MFWTVVDEDRRLIVWREGGDLGVRGWRIHGFGRLGKDDRIMTGEDMQGNTVGRPDRDGAIFFEV